MGFDNSEAQPAFDTSADPLDVAQKTLDLLRCFG
jgi:hypothetical protein